MHRVLITGAAGKIGKALRAGLRGLYPVIRLSDIAPLGHAAPGEEVSQVDIRDLAAVEKSMTEIDCVVHLAGISEEDAWDQILPMNIEGCYNVFEAARRPDSRYGMSKVFGEALGRLFADKHGLSVACLRIGTFRTPDRPSEVRQLLTWISHRDMVQLVRRCIDHPHYHFVVVYGVSANLRSRWDNINAKFLGYQPEDDAEAFAAEILAQNKKEHEVSALFHGAHYCPMEFNGSVDEID